MMMAGQYCQLVLCLLHQVCVRERHDRVETLREVVRLLADNALGGIGIEHDYQQAGVFVFCESTVKLLVRR